MRATVAWPRLCVPVNSVFCAIAFDKDDRVIGILAGPNCRGPEKVRRLREVYGDDMHLTAAYGDTSGDREMLRIADEKGYRVFKGRP